MNGAPRGQLFRDLLALGAAERGTRRGSIDGLGLPRMPAGFRPEDVVGGPEAQGYLPLSDAARELGLPEWRVAQDVARGLLEGGLVGSALYVRPAVVVVMEVAGGSG